MRVTTLMSYRDVTSQMASTSIGNGYTQLDLFQVTKSTDMIGTTYYYSIFDNKQYKKSDIVSKIVNKYPNMILCNNPMSGIDLINVGLEVESA
jgi:hypothetical protein